MASQQESAFFSTPASLLPEPLDNAAQPLVRRITACGCGRLAFDSIVEQTSDAFRALRSTVRFSDGRYAIVWPLLLLLHAAGCSSREGGGGASDSGESLFQNASIPVRAVVVTRGQKPYPLESLEICGSPASTVAPLLKAATEEHERRVIKIRKELDSTRDSLGEETRRLEAKKQEVAADYNDSLPAQGETPTEGSRDSLRSITKMRAQKTRAVREYEENLANVIRPIENQIRALEESCRNLEHMLAGLREGFNTFIFESLPGRPTKRWVTDANGHATVSVPKSEPWYFWTTTTRDVPGMGSETYRWILAHPDDLDAAGKLFFDHRNLLESRGLVVDADTGRLRTNNTLERPSF